MVKSMENPTVRNESRRWSGTRGILVASMIFGSAIAISQRAPSEVETYSDVLDCRDREPFEIPGTVVNLDPEGMGAPISIEELVAALLSRDLAYKTEMLNLEISSSLQNLLETERRPDQMRISFYLESSYANAAKCAADHYQPGDRVLPFVNRFSGRHEDGYVIEREGRIIVRILTYQLVE